MKETHKNKGLEHQEGPSPENSTPSVELISQKDIDLFLIGIISLAVGIAWAFAEQGSPERWYFKSIPVSILEICLGLVLILIAWIKEPDRIAVRIKTWCSYPEFGDYIATLIALIPGALFTLLEDKAVGTILYGLVTTGWTIFLEKKKIFRIVVPIVPIPLWVIGIAISVYGVYLLVEIKINEFNF